MKIGIVPYKNAHPLTRFLDPEQLVPLAPVDLVPALLEGDLDVALLPLYAIIKHKLRMHPDAGIIGCDGPVESVGLFTRSYITDLSQIRSVYMDKESLSSVYLTKIILKKFYGVSLYDLEFFHDDNKDMADAQLLIGDKALSFQNSPVPYQFWDIGKLWKQHTGTGFMFACWASKRTLSDDEVSTLKNAKDMGLQHLDQIIQELPRTEQQKMDHYFKSSIKYEVTTNIKNGLQMYQDFLAEFSYSSPLPKKAA